MVLHDSPLVLDALGSSEDKYALLQWEGGKANGEMTLIDLNTGLQEKFQVR